MDNALASVLGARAEFREIRIFSFSMFLRNTFSFVPRPDGTCSSFLSFFGSGARERRIAFIVSFSEVFSRATREERTSPSIVSPFFSSFSFFTHKTQARIRFDTDVVVVVFFFFSFFLRYKSRDSDPLLTKIVPFAR